MPGATCRRFTPAIHVVGDNAPLGVATGTDGGRDEVRNVPNREHGKGYRSPSVALYASAKPAHEHRRGRLTMTDPVGGAPNPDAPIPAEPAGAMPRREPAAAPPPRRACRRRAHRPPTAPAPPPAGGNWQAAAAGRGRGRGRPCAGDPVRGPHHPRDRLHHRRDPAGDPRRRSSRSRLARCCSASCSVAGSSGLIIATVLLSAATLFLSAHLLRLGLDQPHHAGVARPEDPRSADRERRGRRDPDPRAGHSAAGAGCTASSSWPSCVQLVLMATDLSILGSLDRPGDLRLLRLPDLDDVPRSPKRQGFHDVKAGTVVVKRVA